LFSPGTAGRSSTDSKPFHFSAQGAATDAQVFRGLAPVAMELLPGVLNFRFAGRALRRPKTRSYYCVSPKWARKAETPKHPSLSLTLRAASLPDSPDLEQP
jgi:hypothetical protein